MHEVCTGIYYDDAYRSGNVGLVITAEGAAMVDSPMLPKEAWAWLKKITSLTPKGIALLINTDYKMERVLGNCFFPTTVIGHQLAWAEMRRYDATFLRRYITHYRDCDAKTLADLTKARIVPPELALTADMTIYKGGCTFDLIHVGGHTPASILVHLPERRVLFAGDVVVCGEHPSLAQADSMRWLHALEIIRELDNVDTIIPGQGRPCVPADTLVLSDYIRAMRERVLECYNSGYTRRETVDRVRMQDFFAVTPDRREEVERRIRSSVERVYDEFKKGKERAKKEP